VTLGESTRRVRMCFRLIMQSEALRTPDTTKSLCSSFRQFDHRVKIGRKGDMVERYVNDKEETASKS
jgi:hypothetical protein